jgi:heavy metal translocating P-type ATPase
MVKRENLGDIGIFLVHALPGRFRLRLEQLPEETVWEALCIRLTDYHGVREVRSSRRTSSILVSYDPDQIVLNEILALFQKQNFFLHHVSEPDLIRHDELGLTETGSLISGVMRLLPFFSILLRSVLPLWLRLIFAIRPSWPFLVKGWEALHRGKINIDVLDGLAIVVSLVRRDLGSVMIITTMLSIGEFLEQWTRKRSRDQLAQDLLHLPSTVWVKREEQEIECPLEQVQEGDMVVVRSGGRIPVDGIVMEGEAMVNQASLTGEPLPIAKSPGISVFAGTVVEEGTLIIRADQIGDSTRVHKIVKIFEESERLKAGLHARAEQWADRAVPVTIVLSLLTFFLTRNLNRAVSVLLVDFSCAIKLSTPLTMLSAMREASSKGVLIKGGIYLEKLEQADTYVFDKTGTLTEATPKGVEVVAFNGHDRTEVLRTAACLEEHFPHPLARAVVEMAEQEGLAHKEKHAELEYILAHGIASSLNGKRVLVGSRHFIKTHANIDLDTAAETIAKAANLGLSMLFVGIGPELAGIILLEDPIRSDAFQFLHQLRQNGVKQVMMLTGDGEESAANVARRLNIDSYKAQLLPEDKIGIVHELQRDGNVVAMVGDGINDTPALSAADVGISMKSGADIAHEVCDVLLIKPGLDGILTARYIGQRAMSRLRWNYSAALGVNFALVFLGLSGRISPAVSALSHNLGTILVTANSLRPLENQSRSISFRNATHEQ